MICLYCLFFIVTFKLMKWKFYIIDVIFILNHQNIQILLEHLDKQTVVWQFVFWTLLFLLIYFASLGCNIWVHKVSLTLPLFIDVHVPSQKNERSYMCVLGSYMCVLGSYMCVLGLLPLPLSTIFLLGFGNCSDSVVFFPTFYSKYYWCI